MIYHGRISLTRIAAHICTPRGVENISTLAYEDQLGGGGQYYGEHFIEID